MAVLHPRADALRELVEPLNDGELRVARALSEQLDDSWTVYLQPRLTMDVPDFIAVHERHGVFILEVKDWAYGAYRHGPLGKVECRDGLTWKTVDRQPRAQAYRYLSAVSTQFPELVVNPAFPAVRAAVIVLNHPRKAAQRLMPAAAAPAPQRAISILGEDDLGNLAIIMTGKPDGASNAVPLLRFQRLITPSTIMSDLAEELRLSAGALNVATNPNAAEIRRVRGTAASGKSFGLAARAARLASEGKSVLVLCFNSTLVHYLRHLVDAHCTSFAANPTRVTCVHFHGFCGRISDDAQLAGMTIAKPAGIQGFEQVVATAHTAFEQGFECRFDAVLVDEGQDFTLDWWNLLREHVLAPHGEMLLVSDPTQNIFGITPWTEQAMVGAGFKGPWTELRGSYRLPADMVQVAGDFARRYLDDAAIATSIPDDRNTIAGRSAPTTRVWRNGVAPGRLGDEIGRTTVALLEANPDLAPSDVAFLCEDHRQGLVAVGVIEAAGYEVHHIFGPTRRQQKVRKMTFWVDTPGVKGCTTWSFKGWEARAVVLGVSKRAKSRELAYVAMTRIKADPQGRPGFVTVINADPGLDAFNFEFTRPPIPLPPPVVAMIA